ncbi:hypothetical protein ACF1BQ_029155 [Bradyrhizobium sp. RDT10]
MTSPGDFDRPSGQADEADRASQRDGKAIGRTVWLDDLISQFEVFGATNTNTVDRFARDLAVVLQGRNSCIFAGPFPRARGFHLAAHSGTDGQAQNSLDGEPGFDISVVIVGFGESRRIDGAEEKRDGFEDRGLADVAAAENDITPRDGFHLREVMPRKRSMVRV